jgi:hypothetical protein
MCVLVAVIVAIVIVKSVPSGPLRPRTEQIDPSIVTSGVRRRQGEEEIARLTAGSHFLSDAL